MEASARRRRFAWIVAAGAAVTALVVLVLVLDPFAGELTAEELIAEGDEICAEAHDAFVDLQDDPPTTAREAADLTDRLIGISEDELDEIDDLDGPSELDDPLDRYLDSRQEGIDLLHEGLDAAEDEDAFAYADAQAKIAADQLRRLKLARDVGFTKCSRPVVSRTELEQTAEPPASLGPDAPPTVANPPTGTP
jgi:hypothetical protein